MYSSRKVRAKSPGPRKGMYIEFLKEWDLALTGEVYPKMPIWWKRDIPVSTPGNLRGAHQ